MTRPIDPASHIARPHRAIWALIRVVGSGRGVGVRERRLALAGPVMAVSAVGVWGVSLLVTCLGAGARRGMIEALVARHRGAPRADPRSIVSGATRRTRASVIASITLPARLGLARRGVPPGHTSLRFGADLAGAAAEQVGFAEWDIDTDARLTDESIEENEWTTVYGAWDWGV